jgi:pimeloyl-ACP methyl ester carboxylesterase
LPGRDWEQQPSANRKRGHRKIVPSRTEASDIAYVGAQASAIESGLPSARIVKLPNANHYVFRSNEADVLREINDFLRGLP